MAEEFKCEICGKTFATKEEMMKHAREMHKEMKKAEEG